MKIRGRLREFDFDFNQGKHFVSFTIEEGNLEEVNGLKNRLLSIEFKDVERAKTISQNRYYWTIVSNIADSINSSKEEVYNQHLLNYGHVVAEFKANKEQDLVSNDLHMIRYKSGRKFNYYYVVKGISLMTTREMSDFIEHAISDARDLGIPTDTPDEIRRLRALWENR
jgi:hypothetical protein